MSDKEYKINNNQYNFYLIQDLKQKIIDKEYELLLLNKKLQDLKNEECVVIDDLHFVDFSRVFADNDNNIYLRFESFVDDLTYTYIIKFNLKQINLFIKLVFDGFKNFKIKMDYCNNLINIEGVK